MDMCVTSYTDEFCIVSVGNKYNNINVPIRIRVPEQIKSRKISRNKSLKKEGKTKQNMNMLRIKHNKINNVEKKSELKINVNRFKSIKIEVPLTKNQQIQEDYSLLARIQKFQKQYERVVAFLKDKAIKNQIYKGKKQISRQKYNQIIEYNKKIQQIINQMNKQRILTRYKNNNNKNGPSVRTFQNIKMQWSRCRNIPKITFKKGIQKLYRQVRNIVIFHRFRKMNKVLSIYRNLRQQQNVQQPQTKIINNKLEILTQQFQLQQSQIWEQDSEDRQYQIQLQQKKKHDYYCRKISKMITNKKQRNLGADFTQFTLSPRLLPMDYEQPQAKKHHTFEIKPRIGFDNWVSLEQSTLYNHELMKYHKTDRIPQWQCHPYCEDSIKIKSKTHKITQKIQHTKQKPINVKYQNNTNIQILLDQLQLQKQTINAITFKQIRKQFKQSCLQYDYRHYKTYNKTEYQLQLLNKQQQDNIQLDIRKPVRNNIRDIFQVKCSKQQYLPYFLSPLPSLTDRFINIVHDGLIYQIKKQDIVDFDQPSDLILHKIDYIQSIQRNRSKINNVSVNEKNIKIEDNGMKQYIREWRNQNTQSQQVIFEKIMDNLKRTQIRKYNIAQSKIASFNEFIKRNQNKIYY